MSYLYNVQYTSQAIHSQHCATAFSMQSCAESAYQPYADEYH